MYLCVCGCVCGMCFTLSGDKGDGDGVQGTLYLVWFGSAWTGSTPQIFDASTSKQCQQTMGLRLQPGEEGPTSGPTGAQGDFTTSSVHWALPSWEEGERQADMHETGLKSYRSDFNSWISRPAVRLADWNASISVMKVWQCLLLPLKVPDEGKEDKRVETVGTGGGSTPWKQQQQFHQIWPCHLHNKEQRLASFSGQRVHPSLSTGTGTGAGQLYFVKKKEHAEAHSNSDTSHPKVTLCHRRFLSCVALYSHSFREIKRGCLK